MIPKPFLLLTVITLVFTNCTQQPVKESYTSSVDDIQQRVDEYAEFTLTTDLSKLSESDKQVLPLLFECADIMEELFWKDAVGDKTEFLSKIEDPAVKAFARINYGPWDRLRGDEPFIKEFGEKPLGANYYPADITKEEFEKWDASDEIKNSWYSLIRRDQNGNLTNVPYHIAYANEVKKASELLKKASELAEDKGLKKYLALRAEALLTDDYLASDLAWMDMKTNTIDFVVGPIESYEDGFNGSRSAHSGQILIKDWEWSNKVERFNSLLPELQKRLPVPDAYKQEQPATSSDNNVYDVIYYAGDCNAASKNIAINLPNDPRVHAQKGSRKLQLRNAMQAKFDKILVPISDLLIAENQRKNITFDAFFENVMFHEVGHGLGVKQTINGKGFVKDNLKEYYSSIEEGKADLLGLFFVSQLVDMGEYKDKDLMDNYVTFMAGIFRSIRFGAASAHGKANMVRFNYFLEKGAFTRDEATGTYSVDFDKMTLAMNALAKEIIVLQGDGNYEAAKKMVDEQGVIKEQLQADLKRITEAGIPRDIVFKQGKEVLGL
ncbi:MAG: Zn-dependent hydrolase [Salinivirgaceae bacterium]|nr:Zn-dependent hydrolase [Salinivirgaceae bacterium]